MLSENMKTFILKQEFFEGFKWFNRLISFEFVLKMLLGIIVMCSYANLLRNLKTCLNF